MLTPKEYLTRERVADWRSEYWDGELIPREDASWQHTTIKDDFALAVWRHLKDSPWSVLTSTLKVTTPRRSLYSYPDVLIVGEAPELEDERQDVLLNPSCLVEVFSKTTADRDRGPKFERYKTIPALREYVLVSEETPHVERFVRDGDRWSTSTVQGLDREFTLAIVSATIALSAIYRSARFAPASRNLSGDS